MTNHSVARLLTAVVLGWTAASPVTTVRGNEMAGGCAGPACSTCPDCCVRCGLKCVPGKLVPRTVMVPVTVTETRYKTCIQDVEKEFEVKCTVFERQPVTQTIKNKVCYLEDEVVTQVVDKKTCVRVCNPTLTTFDVEVPQKELRYGPPPTCPCACGEQPCGDCPCRCGEQVAGGCPAADANCVREVCVMRDEPRSNNGHQEDVIFVTKSEVCSYCKKVPKFKEEVCKEITEYKLVPVVKTKKVVECVPEVVKRPIEVKVQKMVPKTIYCCEACCKHVAG